MCSACITHWSKRGCRSRSCTRHFSRQTGSTPFKLLILADAAALSDAQCAAIRAYVERGGSVLATFASSLYDELGVRRADFGLADVFGVSFAGSIDGPMQNSYLNLETDPATGSATRSWTGSTERPGSSMACSGFRCGQPRDFPSPLTLIPRYPDLPMEDVYPRVRHTDSREVYLRESGRSRVAYFPWDIDRTFWDVLSVDHGRLLRNTIAWALERTATRGGHRPWSPRRDRLAPGESLTVHLVNLTNPMMMKGPLREAIPTGAQRVRIQLPPGTRAARVQFRSPAWPRRASATDGL